MKKIKCKIKKAYDIREDNMHLKKTLRKIFRVLNKEINPYVKMKLKIKYNITNDRFGDISDNVINIYPNDVIKSYHSNYAELMSNSIITITHELFHSIQIINDYYYDNNPKYKEIIENQVQYRTYSFLLENASRIFNKFDKTIYLISNDFMKILLNGYKKYKYFDKIGDNIEKFYINKLFGAIHTDRTDCLKLFNENDNVLMQYNGEYYAIKSAGIIDCCWWRIAELKLNRELNMEFSSKDNTLIIVIKSKKQVKIIKGDK